MEKLCPYCEENFNTGFLNQATCHKERCKQQYIAQRMRINHLKRHGKETVEDLENLDRSTLSGFYTYMKKRPFYFQSLSSMVPTSQNIKEYFYALM